MKWVCVPLIDIKLEEVFKDDAVVVFVSFSRICGVLGAPVNCEAVIPVENILILNFEVFGFLVQILDRPLIHLR